MYKTEKNRSLTHRNTQGGGPVAREANVVRVHVEVDAELLRLQLADGAGGALRALDVRELEDVLDDLDDNLRFPHRQSEFSPHLGGG